jgi:hypothetical protein
VAKRTPEAAAFTAAAPKTEDASGDSGDQADRQRRQDDPGWDWKPGISDGHYNATSQHQSSRD